VQKVTNSHWNGFQIVLRKFLIGLGGNMFDRPDSLPDAKATA